MSTMLWVLRYSFYFFLELTFLILFLLIGDWLGLLIFILEKSSLPFELRRLISGRIVVVEGLLLVSTLLVEGLVRARLVGDVPIFKFSSVDARLTTS